MIVLKEFQETAVDNIFNKIKHSLENNKPDELVLHSPTGSGKTIIAIRLLDKLVSELETIDKCFIWLSIGKGGLHKQSLNSIQNNSEKGLSCITTEDISNCILSSISLNQVVVLNWEKINSKTTNILRRDSERGSFEDLINNTKNEGKRIILIIDECHTSANTPKAEEIKEKLINPDFLMAMSATPKTITDENKFIKIPIKDCRDAGLLKKEVWINKMINDNDSDQSSQDLIIDTAHKKLQEIKQEFQKIGKEINPLCIIQIPNNSKDYPEKTIMNSITATLKKLSIDEDNRKLAIYLNDYKTEWLALDSQNNFEILKNFSNETEFLIFKQAIDTGWDCSRAHILIKFRDTKSEILEIQTFGRIMRMPEQKHYNVDVLDTAYCYTNINSPKYEKNTTDILKTIMCDRKNYKVTKEDSLISFYRSATGKKSLKNIPDKNTKQKMNIINYFINFIKEQFNPEIKVITNKLTRHKYQINDKILEENIKIMEKSGIRFDTQLEDWLTTNCKLNDPFFDKYSKDKKIDYTDSSVIKATTPHIDIQKDFEYQLKILLEGYIPSQSIGVLKSGFYIFCEKFIGENDKKEIQKLFLGNQGFFQDIIRKFLLEINKIYYLENPGEYCCWLPPEKISSHDEFIKNNLKKYLYTPPAPQFDSHLEERFFEFIDRKNEVLWWMKNGVKNKQFFGIKYETSKYNIGVFYPDYIIKFTNNVIGIFDTKGDISNEDTIIKAKALATYIEEKRKGGFNITGGIIRNNYESWQINNKEIYSPENEHQWESFDVFVYKLIDEEIIELTDIFLPEEIKN